VNGDSMECHDNSSCSTIADDAGRAYVDESFTKHEQPTKDFTSPPTNFCVGRRKIYGGVASSHLAEARLIHGRLPTVLLVAVPLPLIS
jgi:hypothetical protein